MSNPDHDLAARIRDVLRAPEFQTETGKSLLYFAFDIAVVAGLGAWGMHLYASHTWQLYPVYWLLQGSALWSLFLIGHDAGHGSVSKNRLINEAVGYFSHAVLLVTYYGWARSHNTHHRFAHHMDKDESHQPMSNNELLIVKKKFGITLYRIIMGVYKCGLYVFPYMLIGIPGKNDGKVYSQHFFNQRIFTSHHEIPKIVFSSLVTLFAFSLSVIACWKYTFAAVSILYFLPLVVCMMFFQLVTFLNHTHEDTRWFYPEGWNALDGALETVDYDWGKYLGPVVTFLHHGIERYHVVHHLNLSIPHYKLKKAHEALLPLIQHRYRLERHPILSYLRIVTSYHVPVPDRQVGTKFVTWRS